MGIGSCFRVADKIKLTWRMAALGLLGALGWSCDLPGSQRGIQTATRGSVAICNADPLWRGGMMQPVAKLLGTFIITGVPANTALVALLVSFALSSVSKQAKSIAKHRRDRRCRNLRGLTGHPSRPPTPSVVHPHSDHRERDVHGCSSEEHLS